VRHGATCVYAIGFEVPEADRLAFEAALIGAYNPPCNVQHRTDGVDVAGIMNASPLARLLGLADAPLSLGGGSISDSGIAAALAEIMKPRF
jgi:hypothetical protein